MVLSVGQFKKFSIKQALLRRWCLSGWVVKQEKLIKNEDIKDRPGVAPIEDKRWDKTT